MRRFAMRSVATSVSMSLTLSMLLAPFSSAQAQTSRAAARSTPVTLNFVNAEIEGVARAMSAILNQQFTVDPRVKGQITLYSDTPQTPREAYLSFLAALRGLGFTVVEVGGLYKIVPEADAKLQAGTVSVGGPTVRGDQVLTQIFKLSHENANNLVPVLRPLISPNNTINANPGTNSLVITDYADNLQRIAKIIAAMDTPASGDVEVITLLHAVASDVAPLVQRLTDAGGTTAVAPGVANSGTNSASVLVEPRSNSLLVRAANPAKMASIRALIEKLDKPTSGAAGMGNIWVVYLKNADAVKLATVLRAAYAAGQGSGSGAAGGGGGGAASPINSINQANNTSGATGSSPQATSPVSASAAPSTGGFVQADPATNSLIITAPEPMYRQLRAMIDQLDTRRAQVYIESMIVEVSGNDAAELGFQWQALGDTTGVRDPVTNLITYPKYTPGAGTNFGTAGNILAAQGAATAVGALAGLGTGFNIGVIRNFGSTFGLSAILRVLQQRGDTNIVSTPNLVTLDNEEAKIIVGSNVPFVTGQYTSSTSGTNNPFQTIERKDVGVTLRIRPQIGENGTVRMTLFQESSSLATDVAPGTSNAGPTTNKKSIESTVVVDDGQIIVLGGLIEDSVTVDKSKVPLLGDIPYLGALFRSETRTKKRTNQMVFLRPIVMRDAAASNKLSIDRYEQIRSDQKDIQLPVTPWMPIGAVPVIPPLRDVEGTPVPLAPTDVRPPPVGRPASAPAN